MQLSLMSATVCPVMKSKELGPNLEKDITLIEMTDVSPDMYVDCLLLRETLQLLED